jgi:hypothetical protein
LCLTICRVDYDGLFGWNTVVSNNKEVVITANEFDAMAVRQETGLLSLALPKGDSILPQKVCYWSLKVITLLFTYLGNQRAFVSPI